MQESPLLVSTIVRHGQAVHGRRKVVTAERDGYKVATFAEVARRAEQLANALERLGVRAGDRVATFSWNNQAHLEAYLAVPSMGAVLHTLNVRLFPEQLVYIINHAEDRVIIVDASLAPVLARIRDELKMVRTVIVSGEGDASSLGDTLLYEEILSAEEPGREWPALGEHDAASMCYTSGTTGNPKGVVYSHRSVFLHTMVGISTAAIGLAEGDRILVVVPMFHANAWGVPYSAWMVGADLVFPQHHLQGENLVRIIAEQKVTNACGVPTIWNEVLRAAAADGADLSSLRTVTSGGSATPRAMFEAFDRLGVRLVQGWGMTETSPLGAVAIPPAGCDPSAEMDYRVKTGRVLPGLELRVVGPEGEILPNDGASVGEFEIRGPWVTASYYHDDDPNRFHNGWLRTGDVGTLDVDGYMQITDRTKDVIKSGGEWISSVELEGLVMAHPDVLEAAVIAVPDARWQERPLVCVVPVPGRSPTIEELVSFLEGKVARWWLPERWAFLSEIPKTSVGKFDKKALRADHAQDKIDVVTIDVASAATGNG